GTSPWSPSTRGWRSRDADAGGAARAPPAVSSRRTAPARAWRACRTSPSSAPPPPGARRRPAPATSAARQSPSNRGRRPSGRCRPAVLRLAEERAGRRGRVLRMCRPRGRSLFPRFHQISFVRRYMRSRDMSTTKITGSLYSIFRRGLAKNPGGRAFTVGGDSLTYAELDAAARRLAGGLVGNTAGNTAGHTAVGVLAPRGRTAYTGILAGLYAGLTVVPLNPAFPPARNLAMARAAGVSVLVADGPAAELGIPVAGEGPALD